MMTALTEHVAAGETLSAEQIVAAVEALTREDVAPETKADFLVALARKGETAEEIAGFARELRLRATPLPLPGPVRAGVVLDVVGTGGDRLGTINLSTAAALIAAAAGVNVAKHGNRAVTSKAGSADVLEALGIPIDLTPDEAAVRLAERGFVFLFAPRYHPAFKHIGPARKLCAERGRRTLFNFLGPLLNPAHPTAQLMGVPRPELCEPLARVLRELGVRRGLVVCGRVGERDGQPLYCDEMSPLGPTTIAEFHQERGFQVSEFAPEALSLQAMTLDDLLGGERDENAAVLRRILSGEERGPKRDAVLLNAAAALFTADRARSIQEGWDLAVELVDGGKAGEKLGTLTG
ncbi:MAG: anthranilate phosphoribosyltransferase [Verrucomicrobiae bacterium]|nr:anthranilate phosphoribosyltransferase [Verrucomicrobiae bacterium]